MPFEVDWASRQLVCVRYSGHLTPDQLEAVDRKVYGDPRFDDIRGQLLDFSAVTSITLDTDNVEAAAYQDAVVGTYKRHLNVAYMAPAGDDSRHLLEHYVQLMQSLNARWHHRIFDDTAAALAWLQHV